MEKGVSQRTYKNLKKEIVEDTALNVGYYPKVINEIHYETLLETIVDINQKGWLNEDTSTQELANMIVTEAVKNMNYQEFKDIADNFFSFVPDDKEQYIKAQKIEITRENYEYLIKNTNKALGLERKLEELQKEQNSLENKINSLETKTIPNNNEVIGIDIENEELLLLKAPENSYIDEDIIFDENILNTYKQTKDDHTTILEELTTHNKDIELFLYEYTLNNDTYKGLLDIDYNEIEEIDYEDIPINDFKTHEEYYNYATQFTSFKEKYQNYEEYLTERYNYIYSREYAPNYAQEILENHLDEINEYLAKNNEKLIIKDIYGYSQGESWTLGYLADIGQKEETIDTYLENYVGAWYKGTLTELQIINLEDFEKGKHTGEVENYYLIDTMTLPYQNKLQEIQKQYPELKKFQTVEKALEQEKTQKEEQKEKERRI